MLRQSSERHAGAWVVYPWTTASPHLPMALFRAVVPGEAIWPAGYIFMICTKCTRRTQRRAGLGRGIMLLLAHNNMQLSGDWRTRPVLHAVGECVSNYSGHLPTVEELLSLGNWKS